MKKIWISMLLCLLLVTSVLLTACANEGAEEEADSGKATLTMLVVTERQVIYTDAEFNALSPAEQDEVNKAREQYAAVEAQINRITKASYNTAVKIFYYTPEQYYDALEEKLTNTETEVVESQTASKLYRALVRSEKRLGNTDPVKLYELFTEQYPEYAKYIEDPRIVPEVSVEEEDEEIYPEVGENQVDILFIGSYDKYVNYIEKDWLEKLNDSLNSSAKKLTSFVYPAFLNAVKYEKGYYAIPNNTVIGEYTAMLVNKEMCDRYSDISKITSLAAALDLITMVAEYEEQMDPYWCDSYEGFTNVHFWNFTCADGVDAEGNPTQIFDLDTKAFSVLGTSYNANYGAVAAANANVYEFKNILNENVFRDQLVALKTIELEGYRGEKGSTKDFAVGIMKGSAEEISAYEEDYYTVILENPVATEEDLFGSMFAVCNYSENVNRAMQIITLINTDSNFRNLFQYGLEGTNYKVTTKDCAERTEHNLYDMDIYKTGNVFIAYPDADRGMTQKTLENAKMQDLDVVTNPTVGFGIEASDLPDVELLKIVSEASTAFYQRINDCTSIEQVNTVIDECIAEIEDADGAYHDTIREKAMNAVADSDADFSAYAIYCIWARAQGYMS